VVDYAVVLYIHICHTLNKIMQTKI